MAHASAVPDAFKDTIDPKSYEQSVNYTLAKSRFSQIELSYGAVVLIIIIYSGILPWFYYLMLGKLGNSVWAQGASLFAIGMALSIPGLPFDWYSQFRLEERFGFNTTTLKLWIVDRLKAFLLSLIIGYPLLVLILKLVDWMGANWWLWAWAVMFAFQLIMLVLAPVVILPLFNKFSPLPAGSLRDCLMALGKRAGFQSKSIQIMDGSKRSKHSNAFFTGFGRFRKIVLFDTLIKQLSDLELEAILAHEIGHYKKKHILKMLVWSTLSMLLSFYVIALLAQQSSFYTAFGFEAGNITPALLLFGLLSGVVLFWFSPLTNLWSRRNEYQADAYAAETSTEPASLITALRKLTEKNLSNLTPHPIYSGFYYSHPSLLERETALKQKGVGLHL
jgi:STE24 endopeptidase